MKIDLRAWVNDMKDEPCNDCGRSLPSYVMDFDHRDPEQKLLGISALISNGASQKVILEEIDKCDLVCANCHRIRTHGDDEYDERIVDYQDPYSWESREWTGR